MPKWIKPLLLAGMLSILSACQTIPTTAITAPPPQSKVCTVWKDVTYSGKADTPQTVKEVRANNAAHDAFCH